MKCSHTRVVVVQFHEMPLDNCSERATTKCSRAICEPFQRKLFRGFSVSWLQISRLVKASTSGNALHNFLKLDKTIFYY